MEGLGLGDLLSFKNLPAGQDPVTIFTIMTEIKREVDYWKKECKGNEETVKKQLNVINIEQSKESQMNEQIESLTKSEEQLTQQVQELNGKIEELEK